MSKPSAEHNEIVRSSGNVFAGLGSRDTDERQTKVRLAIAINDVLINQPKISALSTYRLQGFSVERLIRFLDYSTRTSR